MNIFFLLSSFISLMWFNVSNWLFQRKR